MHLTTSGFLCLFLAASRAAAQAPSCHVGSYRLTNGTLVDISPEEGDTLSWRTFDGELGALYQAPDGKWVSTALSSTSRPDGKQVTFSGCDAGIQFDGVSGQRVPLVVRDTTFESHGVTLAGRLVMPVGNDKVPVVVMLHGADPTPALESFFLGRMLPAVGVGAFVFDKRGTGKSGGKYTQDYSLLADDGVAAMRLARRMAGPRLGRIGYQGGSQAGWVEPLAASRAPVDFVIVCYGLAVNVIDEDQESVEL